MFRHLPFTAKRRAALAEMVETSNVRFACSQVMQQDYEQRFRNAWHVLHKGVDPAEMPTGAASWRFTNILYTGGMNMFRFDAVLAFAEGLRRYRAQSGRDITLTLLGMRLTATTRRCWRRIPSSEWNPGRQCRVSSPHGCG